MNQGLLLSPCPKSIELTDGAFIVDSATRIQIGPNPNRERLHAAESLRTALVDLFDLNLGVVPTASPMGHSISLILAGTEGHWYPNDRFGWSSPASLGPEGYTLRIDGQNVIIAGNDEAALFYGAQTLIQIARSEGRRWPGVAIEDRPAVQHRGYLLDITRGKVHSIETLEKLIKTFAHFKCNHLQLYTEHAFDFPSAREIGRDSGALTPAEVLHLDQLCRKYHIELAPNFQSLGHQGQLLKVPEYEHLAETPWRFTFATANDDVFHLLDQLYSDLLPCFQSRLLNVNADEPWDLGRGQSMAMVEDRGIGGLYLHHLKQLHELTKKHGVRMAMWADVLKHHPDLMPGVPDDVLLIDWWYEATDRYESLDALSASGREFWICGATSSWISLYPRLENAISNIRDYVEQGIAAGATGVLISDWGDNGHDQPISHSLYPLLWGAECAWTGSTTSIESFDAAFGLHILHDRSGNLVAGLRRLGRAMQVEKNWLSGWNSAMALYEDPLAGKVASVAPASDVLAAYDAAIAFQPFLGQIPDPIMRGDLAFATRQILFACEKVENTRSIRELLSMMTEVDADRTELLRMFDARVDATRLLMQQLPAMVEEFERRWLASARRSSIQFNLDRFAGLVAQFERALRWLREQRNRFASGNEVDAQLATYDTGGYAVLHEAVYYWIKELEAIIGYEALPADIKDYLRDAGIAG